MLELPMSFPEFADALETANISSTYWKSHRAASIKLWASFDNEYQPYLEALSMAPYHERVGPWPIKRSQSVPDTSAPLPVSEHRPSRLAQLLAKVEEERSQLEETSLASRKHQFSQINWFDDPRYQRSVDLEKTAGDKVPRKKSKGILLDNEIAVLRSILLISVFMFAVVPLHVASFFRGTEPAQLMLPQGAPSAILVYFLISLFAIMVGLVTTMGWSGTKALSSTDQSARLKINLIVCCGLFMGILLSVWWSYFVLPPIVNKSIDGAV